MENYVDKLKKIASQLLDNHYELIKKIHLIEKTPLAKALVGKCFKIQDTFNSRKSSWIFCRIVRRDGIEIYEESFKENSYGRIEFDFDVHSYVEKYTNLISISKKEYFKEQNKLLNKILKRYKKEKNK